MFQHQIRLSLLAVLAGCMLALSGCGGSSTTTPETPDPSAMMECPEGQVGTYPDCMDPPTPAERIAAAQGRADTAATDARADADAAEMLDHQDNADVAAQVALAEAAASAAETLKATADDATDPDVAEALATQAESARGSASTALGHARTASTTAEADAVEAARIAALTKKALTKEMAIGDEAEVAAADDDGLGGSGVTATDNDEGAYNLDIDGDGTTVTVTVEGATDAADEDFMLAMDFMDGRTMHTREHDADDDGNVVEEVVIVAEDRDPPEAVEFAKFEVVAADGTTTTPQELDQNIDTTNDMPDAVTYEALGIVDANLGMVKADAFAAPAGTTETTLLTFQHAVEDNANTADEDESIAAAEIMGTFNGAMGTYKCNRSGEQLLCHRRWKRCRERSFDCQ